MSSWGKNCREARRVPGRVESNSGKMLTVTTGSHDSKPEERDIIIVEWTTALWNALTFPLEAVSSIP